jgi:predicted dehydrogenase
VPSKIALIGCGNISKAYFEGCRQYPHIALTACADLNVELAQKTAAEQGLEFGGSVDELLSRDDIGIVINLTIPAAHAEINQRILDAGKHVYCEKPFALAEADAGAVLATAASRNLRVGSAPDTFLGAGLQTARKLIDDGVIGTPVAATGFMLCPGHESWHPNPGFYYQPGGGPMWDMGPYYITALVHLLGPVSRVSGVARASLPERTITSEPLAGQKIAVKVPTHYSTTLEFAAGPIATLIMSFDTAATNQHGITIHGTEGSLDVNDPNWFDKTCRLRRPGEQDFTSLPLSYPTGRGRGTGVADLAQALTDDRPHRASGELAHHVIEVMQAATQSSEQGRHITLITSCERPAPFAPDTPANATAG